jgi:4,5-epoxidase
LIPPTTTSVLIAGAGPTGLALACDLRSRGIDVMIVDKALAPATTSRALGVQPRGTEILDRLGALGDLPQRAVNAQAINLYSGKQRLFRIEMRARSGVAVPGPLLIGQSEVEGQLRARLGELGREVMWGVELVAAEQCEHDVKVVLRSARGEHLVRADWLVGCDGSHSKTRKLAGIAFDGTAFAEKFLLADVRLDWSQPRQEPVVWLHAGGMFAALPLPGPDVWRIMAELPADFVAHDSGGSISDAAAIDLLQKFLEERVGDTTTRVTDPSWVSVFRFHRRLASSYRRGRILLAGDAAHIHSPFGGQGMNTGLGDAYNLGWKLALVTQGRASEKLLDTYDVERRPVAANVLKNTTTNTNLILGNNLLTRLFRDYAFIPLMRRPAVQRKFQARGSQLNVTYRGGPLAMGHGLLSRVMAGTRSGPKAGDRAPNAPGRLPPAGTPTTLGAQTCVGWALLLFGSDRDEFAACAAAARSRLGKDLRVIRIIRRGETLTPDGSRHEDIVLEDHRGEIAALYRPGDTEVVLLRPDGHIAWRAARPDATELSQWLSTALDGHAGVMPGRGGIAPAAPNADVAWQRA